MAWELVSTPALQPSVHPSRHLSLLSKAQLCAPLQCSEPFTDVNSGLLYHPTAHLPAPSSLTPRPSTCALIQCCSPQACLWLLRNVTGCLVFMPRFPFRANYLLSQDAAMPGVISRKRPLTSLLCTAAHALLPTLWTHLRLVSIRAPSLCSHWLVIGLIP